MLLPVLPRLPKLSIPVDVSVTPGAVPGMLLSVPGVHRLNYKPALFTVTVMLAQGAVAASKRHGAKHHGKSPSDQYELMICPPDFLAKSTIAKRQFDR